MALALAASLRFPTLPTRAPRNPFFWATNTGAIGADVHHVLGLNYLMANFRDFSC